MLAMRTIGLSLLVCVSPLAAQAPAVDEPSPHHYYFQKQRRELRLDPTRLAVMRSPGAVRAAAGLPTLNLAEGQLEAHAVTGWSLAPVDPAQPAADLAARAAAAPGVEFVSPVYIDDMGGPMFVTPLLIVAFEPGIDDERIAELLDAAGAGQIIQRDWSGMPGVYTISPAARTGDALLATANALSLQQDVRFAEPDMIFTGRGGLIPNDTDFGLCWGLDNNGQFGPTVDQDMDGPEAWDITIGSPGIAVLILDTGVDPAHPDLNQLPGVDTTSEVGSGGPVNAFDNHGTPVAGCVSAIINNSRGTVGIAPGAVSVSARTFISTNANGNWTSSASWTVDSLAFGESVGARVSNNSNGYGFSSNAIALKYTETRNAGMVHFASAGNDSGFGFVSYPASLPDVNAVGALDPSGTRASFSNVSSEVFIAAPGVTVYSTDRQGAPGYTANDYAFVSGTSFASPYTAGVAALILSFNSFLTADDVELILAQTAIDRGPPGLDNEYGFGFVNAHAALLITPPPGPPEPFALVTPSPSAINVARRPVFEWSSSLGATSYNLTVDDSPAFDSPIFDSPVSSFRYVWQPASLNHSTTYYWRMTSMNSAGTAASNPVSASFTTISVPPATFSLLDPAPGATGVPLFPLLRWAAADFAESYTVTVDDDPAFGSPIISAAATGTQFNVTTVLAGNTTYYWKVEAANPLGSTLSAPTSSSFTTALAPPQPFSLLTPADGEDVSTFTPTLTWNASPGATSYVVVVDDSLALDSPEVNASGIMGTSLTIPFGLLANNTRYYWRVVAANPAGQIISSPNIATFALVVPPCFGDANGDRRVGFPDITSILANWGGAGPSGDANGDNVVNFVDISSTLANWNNTCP